MLTIVCGEDSISSREYYFGLRKEYIEKGIEIRDIKQTEFADIEKWLSDSVSLFSNEVVFFTENLNKRLSKRSNPVLFSLAERLIKKKDILIIDWEEYTSTRELKLPKRVIIKEFKPPTSIFKLLDACYPGNLKTFLNLLHQLPDKMEEGFIFIMLARHIRNLLLIKSGESIIKLQSWQIAKLKTQAKHWPAEKLLAFYEGLYRIEVAIKTSTNPFNTRHSLDILACYIF